jgi:hypothetical protein
MDPGFAVGIAAMIYVVFLFHAINSEEENLVVIITHTPSTYE